jgi:hypothetical protein
VGRFLRGWPSFAPTPAHSCACASVADGQDPLVSSRFPQSPPLLRLIPTTGAISAKPRREHLVKVALCHPIPSSRCWSMILGHTVTSPPLCHHLSAAPLCHRCKIEMPVLGAQQRGLTDPTLLTELALLKGCCLGPGVALLVCAHGCLGAVHWLTSSRRVDTAPPTLSSMARTTTYGQNSFGITSMEIPWLCLPHCAPAPARVHSRCLSMAER